MLFAVDYGRGVIAYGDIASAAHGRRVLKGCEIFSLVLKKNDKIFWEVAVVVVVVTMAEVCREPV